MSTILTRILGVSIVGMLLGEQNLTYAYWGPRLSAGIGGAFGILALLLT